MSLPMYSAWFWSLLRCPQCGSELDFDVAVSCRTCDFLDETRRDFRLRTPRMVQLILSNAPAYGPAEMLHTIDTTHPALTYNGPSAIRDSRQLMSELSRRLPNGGTVLDLGCGGRDQFGPLNHLGFRYVGVDYSSAAADLLADAHAIPFRDESFDCVFSYAVLEHLHNPFIAIHEVARVLKPGGWFVGAVSQGEPFHNSYFHHTPWGLLSVADSASSLRIVKLWDATDTLSSLASMGRYSRVLRVALKGLNVLNSRIPWLTPRKMMWPDKEKQLDRLYRAGSICFVIEKPDSGGVSK